MTTYQAKGEARLGDDPGAVGTGAGRVLGVDAGSADLREADHLVHRLVTGLGLPEGTVACTHLVRTGEPRVAVSLALPAGLDPATAWARLPELLADPAGEASLAGPGVGAALGTWRYGAPERAGSAAHAANEHAERRSGRAVVYPGVSRLVGTVTVSALLTDSAIERVVLLGVRGGDHPEALDCVHTREHVRPEWRDGTLVLTVVPAAGGVLVPFEVPTPTPCCADPA
jgi:hypothetical protein